MLPSRPIGRTSSGVYLARLPAQISGCRRGDSGRTALATWPPSPKGPRSLNACHCRLRAAPRLRASRLRSGQGLRAAVAMPQPDRRARWRCARDGFARAPRLQRPPPRRCGSAPNIERVARQALCVERDQRTRDRRCLSPSAKRPRFASSRRATGVSRCHCECARVRRARDR